MDAAARLLAICNFVKQINAPQQQADDNRETEANPYSRPERQVNFHDAHSLASSSDRRKRHVRSQAGPACLL